MSDEEEDSSGGGRHRGRQVALQVLYAIDLAAKDASSDEEEGSPKDQNERIFDRISENFVVPTAVTAFARDLVGGVVERIDELDGSPALPGPAAVASIDVQAIDSVKEFPDIHHQ